MNRWLLVTVVALTVAGGAAAAPDCSVSSQGVFLAPSGAWALVDAGWTIAWTPLETRVDPPTFGVEVTDPTGSLHALTLAGEAFFVSDLGVVVAVSRPETRSLPGTVTAFDLAGTELWSRAAGGLSSPAISPDGTHFAFRSAEATVVVNLTDFSEEHYPRLSPFSLGGSGAIVGAVAAAEGTAEGAAPGSYTLLASTDGPVRTFPSARRPQRLAFTDGGRAVLILSKRTLSKLRLSDGATETVFSVGSDVELRDIRVTPDAVCVGMRRIVGDTYEGSVAVLAHDGNLEEVLQGPARTIERLPGDAARDGDLPWPLAPNEQHEVGNTYGEYQNYGGSPYLHPGVDAMGVAGQPVYAVADGVVKAVLTTSGDWHWRVATADSATADTCTGYLYAHLDSPTIAVDVGDTVAQGDYLGDLVEWTTSDFHHVHFARIQDSGVQWYGDWLTTDNPHVDFANQTEVAAPVFEPARGSDLLAFCLNESSEYQNSTALSGAVDIIAHVGDTIECDWVCSVQEIRYTIYPAGLPQFPVVEDKLAVNFDMALDTYFGGPIDPFLVDLFYKQDNTCRTRGDYSFREFYHIITNSDGDEIYDESDVWEAWDTTELPDADYVVRVTAIDAAGNAAADSMIVTTANGNPTSVNEPVSGAVSLHRPFPNPSAGQTSLAFSLPVAGRVAVRVYEPSGRLVRTLVDRAFPGGTHAVTWDGSDSDGHAVASGTYMVRLEAVGEVRSRKLVLAR